MLSTLSQGEIIILARFILLSANAFNLNKSKVLSFGKELTKLKAFADNKIKVTNRLKLVLKWVGKRRKCQLPIFSHFLKMS